MSRFVAFATDPEAEWRGVQIDVRARSRAHAREVVQRELVRQKRSHFTIDIVVEA